METKTVWTRHGQAHLEPKSIPNFLELISRMNRQYAGLDIWYNLAHVEQTWLGFGTPVYHFTLHVESEDGELVDRAGGRLLSAVRSGLLKYGPYPW